LQNALTMHRWQVALALLAVAMARGYAWAGVCTLSASPINLGSYNGLSARATVSVGQISYDCTGTFLTGIKIALAPGLSGAAMRQCTGNNGSLLYFLSLDPAGAAVWGDGSSGTTLYFNPAPATGKLVVVPVYAHAPPHQKDAPTGRCRDVITVVASF